MPAEPPSDCLTAAPARVDRATAAAGHARDADERSWKRHLGARVQLAEKRTPAGRTSDRPTAAPGRCCREPLPMGLLLPNWLLAACDNVTKSACAWVRFPADRS